MNILQITPRIPFPLNDGSAIGIYNITKYLQQAGHSVTMLSLNTKKHYQSPVVIKDVCAHIDAVDIDTTITPYRAFLNLFSSVPYIVERFISREFDDLIVRTLATRSFDVIHVDSIFIASCIDAIKRHTNTPVVLRAHNVEYRILERLYRNLPSGLKRLYLHRMAEQLRRYEQQYFKRFDGILAITPEDYSTIRSMDYTGPMVIMPAGVDLAMFAPKPTITTQPNTVFFFGGLEWGPNQEGVHWFMKQVFPAFRKQYPEVELHIGGKNPPPEILSYNRLPGVTIHPNVPSAPDFMQSYDIMIVPLLSGGGMRLKIVEAMAMGKPIISTPVGAEGIATRPGENILLAETPKEFLHQLALCLEDETLKNRLQQEAVTTARELYSWEKAVDTAIQFYRSLQPITT